MTHTKTIAGALTALSLAVFGGCSTVHEIPPHLRPLPKDALMLLGKLGMTDQGAIFIRILKEESELEVWKVRADGRYYHFKTFPICTWSGDLGPKVRQGDRQSPEGFYTVARSQMNPNSSFHLAFNLGYPNAYDRAHKRTGDFLMVHGKCSSAGCYAMTDGLIEEIYALAREAFIGGQDAIHVHAFPFRMTAENMARHAKHPAMPFWKTLKEGYDHFEAVRQPPSVVVCERRYVVNAKAQSTGPARIDPEGACPALERLKVEAWKPASDQVARLPHIVVTGPKMRSVASMAAPSTATAPAGRMSLGGTDERDGSERKQ